MVFMFLGSPFLVSISLWRVLRGHSTCTPSETLPSGRGYRLLLLETTSEMVWQYTAGGLLAFTVVAIAGPLVAGLAGIGLAVGALYVPAGTTLKYLAGIAAARVGALIAAAWTSRPHLIEAFRVPNQQPFRRIMARDVYGINNTRHVIQHVDDPRGSLETETTLSEASYPPSFR
jgi:hypothetical protein